MIFVVGEKHLCSIYPTCCMFLHSPYFRKNQTNIVIQFPLFHSLFRYIVLDSLFMVTLEMTPCIFDLLQSNLGDYFFFLPVPRKCKNVRALERFNFICSFCVFFSLFCCIRMQSHIYPVFSSSFLPPLLCVCLGSIFFCLKNFFHRISFLELFWE